MKEMEKKGAQLATVTLDIDSATLKKLAEAGNLSKFVETFPVLLAGQVKAQLVEQLAAGGFKVSMKGAYTFDNDEYGNGIPPHPHPHWSELGLATQLRIAAKTGR
jgi:hypothetical protein